MPLKAGRPEIGFEQQVLIVELYPLLVNAAAPMSAQVLPPLVETSTTPPSKVLSRPRLCQNVSLSPAVIAAGAAILRYWSETTAGSLANAACVGLCGPVVVSAQSWWSRPRARPPSWTGLARSRR